MNDNMSESSLHVRPAVLSYPPRMSPPSRTTPDAEGAQSPPAAHRDNSLATNPPPLVPEDHPPKRRRGGWGLAGVIAVIACLALLAWPTAAFAQTTAMSVNPITGDGVVTALEKWNGFEITGNTGTSEGAVVTVTVNGTQVGQPTTSAKVGNAILATWSVNVLADQGYIYSTAGNQPVVASSPHLTQSNITISHTRNFTTDLTLPLSVNDITDDNNTINAQEKTDGFIIGGNTVGGLSSDPVAFSGVTVEVTIGTGTLTGTSNANGVWGVTVPSDAGYITESITSASVKASMTGYTDATAEPALEVDLTAPSVSYTASSSLKVGVSIASITPTTNHTDINSYSAASLPPGLTIDEDTGVISGTPTDAESSTQTATVTITDNAGNEGTTMIVFPAVTVGDQTLVGFAYDPATITFGDAAPTLTAPTVTVPATGGGTVTYSAAPDTVCTVDSSDGALTIIAAGTCTITATAAVTDDGNYNATSETVDVTVDKADQTLVGFAYDPATITFGDAAPTLTAPTVTVPATGGGTVTYSAAPDTVCTVDSSDGALTIIAAGTCTITATAAVTDDGNYNATSETVDVTVDKADQTLVGFAYDPATITFGDAAPTLTAPTVTVPATGGGTVTYSAAPDTVCTVDSSDGALTIIAAGTCTITATAAQTANYKAASLTFDVTVAEGTQTLTVDAVTGDNTINISEEAGGFQITGTVTESGATIVVTIGGSALPSATSRSDGTWSVDVLGDSGYINETSVELSVTASKTGYTDATVTRTLPVDLTAPTVSYNTVQSRLFKGVAIGQLSPDLNNSSNDIASYAASNLPQGLAINQTKGFITGNPQSLNNNTQTATVTVTDTSGNTGTTMIVFPAVVEPSTVMISPQVLTVPEDSSAEYTVVLDIEPTHDVTVTVERGAGSDADLNLMENLDSLTLTFTDQDWDRPQTVTIFAAEDDDGENGIARFLHDVDSDDLSYNGIPVPHVRATEGENDTIGVTVLPTTVTVPEGGSVEYTLVLNTLPEGEVKIDVLWNSGGDADLTASTDELTFTSLNWQTAQPVTISAAEDDDRSDGTATFEHSVTSLYDEYYNDDDIVEDFQVIATEYDNDKDAQTLSGFTYSPSQIIFGDDSPTLTAPTVTVPATGGGTVTYSAAPDTVCTVDSSDGALTIIAVGTCRITATAAATDEGNYNATSVTVDVTVDKADQTLSGFTYNGSDSATVTYGNDPLELTALSGAVGAVTYSSSDTDVCTFDSSTSKLTIAGAGTCTITATSARTANYKEASVTFELTVDKKGDQTLEDFAYSPSQITFGNDAPTLTAPTVTVPATGGGTVTYSAAPDTVCTVDSSDGALTIIAVGTCRITATAAATDEGNYNATSVTVDVTVDKADQTLSGFTYNDSNSATVTYGDDPLKLTALSGAVGAVTYSSSDTDVCTFDSSTSKLTIAGAGTCTITATSARTANYKEASVTFELTVDKKGDQTLEDFAYSPSQITFGNDAPTLTAPTVTVPATGGGTVTYSAAPDTVCTVDSSDGALTIIAVGTCRITATAAATDEGNYNATSVTVDVTVDKADQTLSGFTYNDSNSATVTYGNDPLELTALSGAVGAVTYSSSDTDVCTFDSSTSMLTIAGAGDCTITATAAQTANYKTESVTFDVEVAKADQTLEGFAYNASQVNFGTTPTLTAPSGAKTTVTYAASPATVCSVDSSSGALTIIAVGTCTITASALADDNYNAAEDVTFVLLVQPAGTLVLNVDAVAGDNTIIISEKAAGFSVTGNTGTETGASVDVSIGSGSLSATSDSSGEWSVRVRAGASYLMGTAVTLSATATKAEHFNATPVNRVLPVDLAAPTVSYTAPASLQVGVAIASITPTTSDTDIVSYAMTSGSLPPGLSLNGETGVITGTQTTANRSTQTATVTATDGVGNEGTATIVFPAVDKGDQMLEGFAYSVSQVNFGTTPTLTAPSGAKTTVTYAASPATVCSVDSSSGALTIIAVGTCTITASAAADDNYNAAEDVTFVLLVQLAGTLVLNVDAVAGDNTIIISEKAAGFSVTGNTGTESGVMVAVTIGGTALPSATSDNSGEWSVNVPDNEDYITETSVTLSVTATKAEHFNATPVNRVLPVDLVAPTVSYTAPVSLQVGVAIASITPTTSDTDIVSYAMTSGSLPAGLTINEDTGVISGTPTAAGAAQRATVTVTDNAGNVNTDPIEIDFPAVAKGDQMLEGFTYSASQVTYGDPAPTVTAPSGARTEVTYAATPGTVCTVNASLGALTITGGGTCTITATAAQTANYNAGTATFSVEMLVAGLTLRLDKIAGDNIINEEEKRDGFTISGDTGTESGVTVAVTIGGNELTSATSDANGNWSVSVPEDASSITEPSVWVLVTATHPNMSPTLTVSRELVVDLRDLTNLQVPMKVTDFRVAVADADTVVEDSYVLSWEDPGDNTIIKYEYRWYPRASWSEWTDIPESDTTSYTVAAAEAGLDLNTPYRFQIRAVNAKGAGPPSEYAANALLLPVHFGAAAYETEEGGAATTVTVTLSWPATKKLTIPIRVTPQVETVAADYMVAVTGQDDVWDAETGTVRLTFEVEGKRTRSFTIKAGDETGEKDFDDGTVLLSFGALPVGLIAGAPATATLTIIDDEGAVVRARFRRLNNEILSKHALTLADVTIAAVTSRQETGPRCAVQANTASLGGQSSLAEILTANAQTLTTGSLNLKQLLGTSSFRLRLTEDGSGAGPGCLTLWGQGDYRNLFSGDSQALDWDGDLITGQVGADVLLQPDLRAGLAVSWSEGDFGYTDRTDGEPFSGAYTSRIESVHPYVTWWSPMGLDVWATGGYGRGKIEIEDEEVGTHSSDTTLRLASVGASGPLLSEASLGGTTTVRLKTQASLAQMEVEGNGSLLEEQTIAAQRLRLAMEGSHERTLASGGSLTPSFEVGLRHDVGAGATGTGLELGGGLRYVDPALGLTVEVRGRVLAAYEEAYEEWGASGLIRVDPGSDGQGLSLSLAPSYGQTASGMQRLWDQGLPQGPTQGPTQGPSATQAPTGWLEAEVGYGLAAFAGQGLVTPYGQFSLGGGMQQYRVGSRLELGSGLRLSLEGTRQVTTVGQADQGIRLQADWQF